VGTPRHSLLRSGNNPEDESSAEDNSEHDDDDDDKSAPQWFRQLQGYESGEDLDLQESVEVIDMYSHSCNSLLYMYLLYMIVYGPLYKYIGTYILHAYVHVLFHFMAYMYIFCYHQPVPMAKWNLLFCLIKS